MRLATMYVRYRLGPRTVEVQIGGAAMGPKVTGSPTLTRRRDFRNGRWVSRFSTMLKRKQVKRPGDGLRALSYARPELDRAFPLGESVPGA